MLTGVGVAPAAGKVRVSRRPVQFGSKRPVRVYLDDQPVAELPQGETVMLPVANAGAHRLRISQDYLSSRTVQFDLTDGGEPTYECWMPTGVVSVLRGMLVAPRRSIALHPLGSEVGPIAARSLGQDRRSRAVLSWFAMIGTFFVVVLALGAAGLGAACVSGVATAATVSAGMFVQYSSAPLSWWRRFRGTWRWR